MELRYVDIAAQQMLLTASDFNYVGIVVWQQNGNPKISFFQNPDSAIPFGWKAKNDFSNSRLFRYIATFVKTKSIKHVSSSSLLHHIWTTPNICLSVPTDDDDDVFCGRKSQH